MSDDLWINEPDLQIAKWGTILCSLGERVFVFGGGNEGSVESLRVEYGQEWQVIIKSQRLTQRRYPALAVLNEH